MIMMIMILRPYIDELNFNQIQGLVIEVDLII